MQPPEKLARRTRAALALSALAALMACGPAPDAAARTAPVSPHPADPSPHRAGRVEVAANVHLEYLDWGGSGEPLVFLAGLGETAHAFDDFAPRFADRFRVLGLTRRGSGGSDRPSAGYDTGTLVADLRAALDALGVERVTLVAHSIGGAEASAFAVAHPERVSRLVFLDSADFGCDPGPAPGPPPLSRPFDRLTTRDPYTLPLAVEDRASALTERAAYQRRLGWSPTLGELLARRGEQPQGKQDGAGPPGGPFAVMMGKERCIEGVTAPALLVTVRDPASEWEAYDAQGQPIELTPEEHRKLRERWAKTREAVATRFAEQIPGGRVVAIPGAHHQIFLSHPEETFRAVRDFLAGGDR